MTQTLEIRAGKRAREVICERGLSASDVRVIAGAAGGPKWLALAELDRFLFGTWLGDADQPVHLIGASAGAWRFAALATRDCVGASHALQDAYIHQRYARRPGPFEVSKVAMGILGAYINEQTTAEILQSRYHLCAVAVRARHLLASTNRQALTAGSGAAALANALSRRTLPAFFESVLFHAPLSEPPLGEEAGLARERVPLTNRNLRLAVLASGSIPMVMSGVGAIPDAPPGVYYDGGIVDYHLALPYEVGEGQLVLYPHFARKVVPGWFDKMLPWRKARSGFLDDVVLLSPSAEFEQSLPLRRIPDRKDFYRFEGRDDERIDAWTQTAQACHVLAEQFEELAGSPKKLKEIVKPL
ncbi:MAG: patatin-like phospholipase family protein [Chrysiogenetes bacterium]|nr:patatin-like phospholipase family protein [Chrysiogenetes bacterium]